MIFRSRKDLFATLIIFGLNTLLITALVYGFKNEKIAPNEYWLVLPIAVVVALLTWLYFDTSYKVTPENLSYKSGPIKGNINVQSIKEIVPNKMAWTSLKLATATKGLLIKYNKYDDIYISPKSNTSFIKELLKYNSNIKIASIK